MFNPFKIKLTHPSSIPLEEREKFLEFVCKHLRDIGCNSIKKRDFEVNFSRPSIDLSAVPYDRNPLIWVDGGVISLSPLSNQITYEYGVTTLSFVWCVTCFLSLFFGLSQIFPWAFSIVCILGFTIVTLTNRFFVSEQQEIFLQQLEPEYQRMKQVFAQPR